MKRKHLVKTVLLVMFLIAGVAAIGPSAFAQEEEHGAEAEAQAQKVDGIGAMGIGIGAGLAVGIAGLATGLAQSAVGAGGTGAIAEKPELFGQVLILFAIPETIVLFGFVIGIMLLGKI